MTHPIHGYNYEWSISPFVGTIWADGDLNASQWVDEGGTSGDVYTSVNAENNLTYAKLAIVSLNNTKTLTFRMQTPTTVPISSQTVYVQISCKYLEPSEPLPTAPELTIYVDENTSNIAASSAQSLTTGELDYTLYLSSAEISSVGDWADIEVRLYFDNTVNTGPDEEADYNVYEVRMIFAA